MSLATSFLTVLEKLAESEPAVASAVAAWGAGLPPPANAIAAAVVEVLQVVAIAEPALEAAVKAWATGADHPIRPEVDRILGPAEAALAAAR